MYVGTAVDGSGFASGSGSSPALLNNVQCSGREGRLLDCMSDPIGMPSSGSQVAAIMCQNSVFVPFYQDILVLLPRFRVS